MTPKGDEYRENFKESRHSAVKSMILSQKFIPPLTLNVDIDMSEILKTQRKLKTLEKGSENSFSSTSFIIKAISLALKDYPKLNSYYDPKSHQLVVKAAHHMGVARETSEGVVVPVMYNVNKMSLKGISNSMQEMIDRLRNGLVKEQDLQGSTITVSNFGTIGATNSTPIIMYPNTAAIGFNKIIRKPIAIKGDNIRVRSIMNFAITVDQRVIDAADAGMFLTRIKDLLEKPELITLS
ncbi:2-oxo acid dehydrogenase subunit E2 [Spiroplasma endosymbiont of Anurida maritima]|uniref:2-oxo acid dehydrogenase subunit E2 n=1 Tax=Spiroplasma endosymbiont of Anurida maritima TaxID=2967972 RepID=UPI0036D3E577